MPGGRTSQDRPPATDIVSGGPSAVLAAALNDKLNRIAQRFDQLERRQDAAERHSDDVVQQLQLLLQWARQCDEAEQALTDDNDHSLIVGWLEIAQGTRSPQANRTRVMSKLTCRA